MLDIHPRLAAAPIPDAAAAATDSSLCRPTTSNDSPTDGATQGAVAHPQHSTLGLHARSCNTCRRRKVKCDKVSSGCANCAKANIECVFPSPGRAPRRPKTGKVPSARETELLKRLRRLEGVVEELSGQVEAEGKLSPSSSGLLKDGESETGSRRSTAGMVRVIGMDEGSANTRTWINRLVGIGDGPPKQLMVEKEFGKLVIDEGKSHYVSNDFWANLNNEVEDIRELAEESLTSDDQEEYEGTPEMFKYNQTSSSGDHHSFLLGYSSSKVSLRNLHPLPSQVPFYWETYVENVDPLTKLMHVPTMTKTIKEVKDNMDSLSSSLEALLFAIYFSVITSMTGAEVHSSFGEQKSVLLARYRFGTEQALARAGFLGTEEIVTVQAFVLFLICVRRHDQTRFVWSLTGLAIRLGLGLGLHRDGTKLGLSPFDTEMRRRLWWQINVLDVRSSEDYGSDPSIREDSHDVQLPTNCNDTDLDPMNTNPPEPLQGVSEMTFCLIRYEICNACRRLMYVAPGNSPCRAAMKTQTLADKELLVKNLHERLEEKYLQYCVDAGPLFWVAATIARLIVAKLGLMVYHGDLHTELPQSVKDRLFVAAIEIMEYSRLLETEASTKKWGWLFHTYIHWHAIARILREICERPYSLTTERAWRAVEGVYAEWGKAVRASHNPKNGMLWLPMRKLMARARRKRESDLQAHTASGLGAPVRPDACTNAATPPPPTFDRNIGTHSQNSLVFSDDQHSSESQSSGEFSNLNPIRPLQQGLPTNSTWMTGPDSQMNNVPAQIMAPYMIPQSDPESQSLLQMQFQQLNPLQPLPWMAEDSLLLDLDMSGVEPDISWEGWDNLVRDFQVEVDSRNPNQRGPALGGIGSWW